MAADNATLGVFRLEGLPAAPRGIPQIEVAFDIDSNGIVNVAARDVTSGREQSITVNATGTLSEEEIQQIIADNAGYELPGQA